MHVLPHTRNELNLCLTQNRRDRSYRDTLLTFFLQKCGAYLRAVLNTIVIPLSTVFTRISAAALINSPNPMRRLFEGGACSSNYCNWQLKSLLHLGQIVITFRTLLHLGQNVITFRTLLHLGSFITFRPSTSPFFFSSHIFIWARCSTHSATSFSETIYLSEYSVMTSLSPLTNILPLNNRLIWVRDWKSPGSRSSVAVSLQER